MAFRVLHLLDSVTWQFWIVSAIICKPDNHRHRRSRTSRVQQHCTLIRIQLTSNVFAHAHSCSRDVPSGRSSVSRTRVLLIDNFAHARSSVLDSGISVRWLSFVDFVFVLFFSNRLSSGVTVANSTLLYWPNVGDERKARRARPARSWCNWIESHEGMLDVRALLQVFYLAPCQRLVGQFTRTFRC